MESIPAFSISRRVTTVMVFSGIMFLGIISATSLPQELFPRIAFPQITVVTNYVNAAPEEIETLITRPLEEAISSTSGLRKLESVSQEGTSTIFVSFGWNENVDFAALAVREKIDLVKERLPKEADDPIVLKFDPLTRPTMIFSVTGKLSLADLKSFSEQLLKENLEKIEGVASVRISGGLDREIQVELDQGRLQSAQVSILDVVDAIDNANISYPAGGIKKGLYEYLIRTVGEFRSVAEIGYTVVTTDIKKRLQREPETFVEKGSGGIRETVDTLREERARKVGEKRLVLLNDVGTVKDGFHERTTVSRYNRNENITVAVQKQGSANAVEVAARVRRELEFLRDDFETRGLSVRIVYDQSEFIKKAIASVRDAAIQGGLLTAVMLYLFFRDWASALIVATSIPISVMGTFFLFQLQGITINMMSLFGLALGSGMTVDTSIVVIENIFRLREKGLPPKEASVAGANEVFWPIFSSTATTCAVFFPMIIFVPGVTGQLFKDLSWAVIYNQTISLFVAAALVPMLAVSIQVPKSLGWEQKLSETGKRLKQYLFKRSRSGQNRLFSTVVATGFASFFVGLLIFKLLDTEVLPKIDQGQFLVKVNLPVGSLLEATDGVVRVIEDELTRIPEVENVSITIGSAKTSKVGEVNVETLRPNQALVLVMLKKKRHRPSAAVVAELRDRLGTMDLQRAEIEYVLQESEFEFAASGGKPIVVEVKGYDLTKLLDLAGKVGKLTAEIPGTAEILNDFGEPSPETKVEIDRKRAALYAISARDIALTSKAAIEGAVATQYKELGHEVDVRVRLQEKDRKDLSRLSDLLVYSHSLETQVPLKEVGTIKLGYGPSEIRRKDQIRTVTVTAAIKKGFKEKDILAQLIKKLQTLEVPKDYTLDLTGKAREVKESFRRVLFAIILALILNYMIMAAQFESFLHPFIIMLTVPLAMLGVAVALLVTGMTVNVISLLGILILAGTVVNNAIVLIDFINQARREGVELVEASIDAVVVRFRPIVMSTLTSVVGLIPLALGIGEGAELQAPLAIAVIGGLLCGTLLTLCVVPAFYILATRLIDRLFGDESLTEGS